MGDCAQCAPNCPKAWQGDGVCDAECNIESCNYDASSAVAGCTNSMASNFNYLANVDDGTCSYSDGGRRLETEIDVNRRRMQDTVRLQAGSTLSTSSDCQFGPFTDSSYTYCAAGCKISWIGDTTCDPSCNNAACNYDTLPVVRACNPLA